LVGRIQFEFDKLFDIAGSQLSVSTSIGIAYYPDADNLDLLIKQADRAMYEAKKDSRSSTCFFSAKIASQFARAQRIESSLADAIEKREIFSVFQPIVSTNDAEATDFEALARWQSHSLGFVGPDEFIPIAENTPAINGITRRILEDAQNLLTMLERKSLELGRFSINVSAAQLASDSFVDQLSDWLNQLRLSPEKICLELTERQIVQNIEQCKNQFSRLKSMGIQLSLDDFGSGFSSIAHLLELPFDILKLDRSLVSNIDENHRNQALVAGAIEMAHRLDMKVVAEGIETEQEKVLATDLCCDYLQGYLFSKPLALESSADFLRTLKEGESKK